MATGLVTALVVFDASMLGSVNRVVDLAGGSDIEVAALGPQGFDEGLLDEVEAVPGVEIAAPIVRAPVAINGRPAVLFGVNLRMAALNSGLAPTIEARLGPDADPIPLFHGIGVSSGLGVATRSARVAIATARGARDVNVIEVIHQRDLAGVNGGRFGVALLVYAQELTGRTGRLDAIYVKARAGVDRSIVRERVAKVVGARAAVGSPALFAQQTRRAMLGASQLMLFALGLVVVVAGLLVFDTMSMAALERRRELATMRALGGRRRSLMVLFELEAGVLGLIGALGGVVIGLVAAGVAVGLFPPLRTTLVDIGIVLAVPAAVVPVAIVATVVACLGAGLPAARRATRTDPAEVMRSFGALETAAPVVVARRWAGFAVGVFALAVGIYLTLVVGASHVVPGVITALVLGGAALATFAAMGPLSHAAALVAGAIGASGRLAAVSAERSPRRTWATIMAVGLAGVLVVAIGGITTDVDATLRRMYAAYDQVDLTVQTSDARGSAVDLLLPGGMQDALRHVRGVASVAPTREVFVTDRGERVGLEGVSAGAASPLLALADAGAQRAVRDGTGAIVTRSFARPRGLRVGSTYDVATPGGPQSVKVAGVVDYFSVVGQGFLAVSFDRVASWTGERGASTYQLTLAPGIRVSDVRPAIARATATTSADVPVFVLAGHDVRAALNRDAAVFLAAARIVLLLAVIAAVFAAGNTTMIAVLERRRELGALRAIGATRRQIRRMVMAEAASVAVLGGVFGCGLGFVLHLAGVQTLGDLVGFDVHFAPDPVSLVVAAAACAAVTVGGALIPAQRAGRFRVAEAVTYE